MRRPDAGQAAVEAALVLPLVVFIALGTLQLFLMLQARQMAQYAAFWAAREGSVTQGRCDDMQRVTLKALLPTFTRVRDAAELQQRSSGYEAAKYRFDARTEPGFDGTMFWLLRDAPRAGSVVARDEETFDQGGAAVRLEVRLVFWYPMQIPFASSVMAQISRAVFGLGSPRGADPLMPVRDARWRDEGFRFRDVVVRDELLSRLARGERVFPITVTSSMRMMTPPAPEYFDHQDCSGPGST
ncbi:MAG: pilus assembly protein [Myxococcaceae bacterium]|nr:pilus assembly protein [Myxococcaceae bacterium]